METAQGRDSTLSLCQVCRSFIAPRYLPAFSPHSSLQSGHVINSQRSRLPRSYGGCEDNSSLELTNALCFSICFPLAQRFANR